MKWDNPLLATLRWVLFGGIVGVMLYLAHLILLHQEEDEVDHSSYSARAEQP